MIVEVYITNGDSSSAVVIKDNETQTVDLLPDEIADLNTVVTTLQEDDVTNCGWLIPNEEQAGMYFKHPNIDNNITCTDKGGNITDENSAFSNVNSLVTSILNRI